MAVGEVSEEPQVPTRHSPPNSTDTYFASGFKPSAVAFSEICIVPASNPAFTRYAAISSDVVSASVLFWYAVFMMERKYGKFSLGVPLGISFGALRDFATAEPEAVGETDASPDGTGMSPNEHELSVRATPTAKAETTTRRNANLF